ncbi:MAG: SH3 domain-containing protein [Clostridia bacterium]|nr:SH3 domain-containing protein [Clostridia bacterium]
MRKLITWLLIALMALQCVAFAETSANTVATAVNGGDMVRTATDIYMAIPAGEREMLVRIPLAGGDPVCVDRADHFEDLMPYAGGVAYLKTTDGSSAIMNCVGNNTSTIYGFGANTASSLSSYGGKLLVLTDGLLHSIEPGTQLCLKLSGAQMLDYVLGEGCAYFLSGGDRMEYTAQLEGDTTAVKQAGCVYRLDLNSGETTLLLKSGGEHLKISGINLYFHNLADAYAVRSQDAADLLGRVYSMDVQLKTLEGECTEPDNGFWPLDKGLAVWYNGAVNMESEAGTLALYTPEADAVVVSDGTSLYFWESGKQTLTQVSSSGEVTVIYTGDLTAAMDASLIVPDPTATVEPSAEPESDTDESGNAAWFEQFMENKQLASGGSSSSGSSSNASKPKATPIGVTPTPIPAATRAPSLGSTGDAFVDNVTSGGSGSTSSGSSSSGNQSSGNTYSISYKYVKVTGGTVNIRSKAGMNGSVLTSVNQGAVISCLGVASKDSSGMTWYKVKANGKTGWISSRYAKKASAPSASSSSSSSGPEVGMSGKYVKASTGSVTLRSKPNLNGTALDTIAKGKTVTFLNKASTDSRGVVWFKVKYNGKTGWVSSKYTKVTDSAGSATTSGGGSSSTSGSKVKVVGGDVTIRAKANKTSNKLGYIKSGNTATYLGKSSVDSRGIRWYYVEYKGTKGWVSSMYSKLV